MWFDDRMRRLGTIGIVVLAVALLIAPASAQQRGRGRGQTSAPAPPPLDRSKVPPPGKPPALVVPTWTEMALANGADLYVSEKRDLPLVSCSVTFMGGADQFETADRRGLASFVASMMSEGTSSRDGEALSNALQLLGTSIQVSIGAESGGLSFQSTTARFQKTLDVLVDMMVNPVFPDEALERLRAQRLVALAQAKSQSGAIAGRAFPRLLYGPAHPYGQPVTEATVSAITRDDIVTFHGTYFRPSRALVTIVGDVDTGTIKATIDKAFAPWPKGGARTPFAYPPLPERHATAIYLIDLPGAAQSTFAIGLPGPPRSTPDFYALQVMNTILGGFFQSRLNMNIREAKGYSYGVSSSFAFGRGPGAFRAGGDVVSAKTDAALIEFMKELRGMSGTRPVTDAELTAAKTSLVQRLPGTFGSVASIGNALTTIWTQDLPVDYYHSYANRINGVTQADVVRVAKQYLDLDHLAIVIVGDRATIETPLRATNIAPVIPTDADGVPLSGSK